MLILNDVHLGVQRMGGTTPTSREAMRQYLFDSFEGAVDATTESHICILGDLFDKFEVEGRDWVQCYMILAGWLDFDDRQRMLTLVAGNHDHSPKALRVSSFEMLCKVLQEQFGDQVQVVGIDQYGKMNDPREIADIVLAHCSNQDIFTAKLIEVLAVSGAGTRVFLHANYANNFAAQSDHSLNVTVEMAKAFAAAGATLYFAHEHQARTELGGRVVVFGNQWPTSIIDCQGNDKKHSHILCEGVTAIQVETWCGADEPAGYCEVDWHDLGDAYTDCGGFFKVIGTATANEAGDCMSAIAKFRAKSSAFVVTNGVHIEGVAANEDLPETFEAAKAFDVMEFINSNLDTDQQAAVKRLMEVQ